MAQQHHDEATTALRIDVLGPLRLRVGGQEVDVPGPRRRAVLALLAVAGGRSVSVEELLDAVWPDEMPDSGRRVLHSHVSRLRAHLGPAGARLERTAQGYRLPLAREELDAAEAADLAARARALRSHDPAEAAALLRAAVGLWRGAPLAEFPDVAPLAAEATALSELHAELDDELLEARLAAAERGGDVRGLAGEALRAVAVRPDRERTQLVAMRALAAEGRHAEALRLGHDFRRRLGEETGLTPTPALAELEQLLAAGDAGTGRPGTAAAPPKPLNPLIGRVHELHDVERLLRHHRLVSVVGPGGVGKTRLALEVAGRRAEPRTEPGDATPVTVLELAVVESAEALPDALRSALRLTTPERDAVLGAIAGRLGAGPQLLVLDNCEHLADACRDLAATLLRACPELTLLATSREPLGVSGEQVLRLGPLAVPTADGRPDDVAAVPAVQAFVDHARRKHPGFAPDEAGLGVVGEITRRLDGLPLALELAAGRVGVLGLEDLRDRLDRAFDVLASPRPSPDQRHRTLRHTIEWSYRLLSPAEQRLFRILSVRAGGFDLDAVEHAAAELRLDDGEDVVALLARLVDTSMVVADAAAGGRPARYAMLETIRAYGLEQLDALGERGGAELALAEWAAHFALEVLQAGLGPAEPLADARLRRELANLRVARDAALARAHLDPVVTTVLALDRLVLMHGLPEPRGWSLELAELPALLDHPSRPKLLGSAALGAWQRGELDRAERLARAGLAAATAPGDRCRAFDALATVALFRGRPDLAWPGWLDAADDDPIRLPSYAASAALGASYAGDDAAAAELVARSLGQAEELGTPGLLGYAMYAQGEVIARHDPDEALAAYDRAIELGRMAGAGFVEGVASVGRVSLLASSGRIDDALAGYRDLVAYWRDAGNWTQLWTTLRNLAILLVQVGRIDDASLLLAAADAAPEAAAVDADRVPELVAARARVEEALSADGLARAARRAAGLPRRAVLDVAFTAIAAASPSPV